MYIADEVTAMMAKTSEVFGGYRRKVWDRYEPGHEKICLKSYANDKGADQPLLFAA